MGLEDIVSVEQFSDTKEKIVVTKHSDRAATAPSDRHHMSPRRLDGQCPRVGHGAKSAVAGTSTASAKPRRFVRGEGVHSDGAPYAYPEPADAQ